MTDGLGTAWNLNPALWPSERGDRIGRQQINGRLANYRDAPERPASPAEGTR